MKVLLAVTIVVFTTIGQIWLKKAANAFKAYEKRKGYIFLGGGYTIFSLTIVVSFFLMKIISMKYFTIIMSTSYISVMVASALFLGEKISPNKFFGTLMVFIGIFVFVS